jgi:hypothetical protein
MSNLCLSGRIDVIDNLESNPSEELGWDEKPLSSSSESSVSERASSLENSTFGRLQWCRMPFTSVQDVLPVYRIVN